MTQFTDFRGTPIKVGSKVVRAYSIGSNPRMEEREVVAIIPLVKDPYNNRTPADAHFVREDQVGQDHPSIHYRDASMPQFHYIVKLNNSKSGQPVWRIDNLAVID